MEPTQPIIPSNLIEFRPDTVKNTEEDEDDNDWQLKFSESQTQDMLNFNNSKGKFNLNVPLLFYVKKYFNTYICAYIHKITVVTRPGMTYQLVQQMAHKYSFFFNKIQFKMDFSF